MTLVGYCVIFNVYPQGDIMTIDEQKEALWEAVTRFVDEQKISCGEAIYQCDWVSESALEFIEELCDIVGYAEYEEDEI